MSEDAQLLRKGCDYDQRDRHATPDLVAERFHEWPAVMDLDPDLDSGESSSERPPQQAVSATAGNGTVCAIGTPYAPAVD